VFENCVLRKAFGPKRHKVTGENYKMRSFMICAFFFFFLASSRPERPVMI
jgi:hypothetical protein